MSQTLLKIYPHHIGIILDGNRRWAKAKNLPIKAGHLQGAKALKKIIEHTYQLGIPYLSVYAFSTENWNRDKEEVDSLMKLFYQQIEEIIKKNKDNIKIVILGDKTRFNEKLYYKMCELEEKTKNNTGMTIGLCMNYSGRTDILQAVKSICQEITKGNLTIDDLSVDCIHEHLYTKTMPDPDFIIRTSGEKRMSDFLTFQSAYAEFYFTDTLWPDFKPKDLDNAILEYSKRERRFGGK